MGIFSWLRPRKPADQPAQPQRKHSLIRYRYEDPKLEKVEREAAADVAQVEEDAKYFHRDDSNWEG
jgi:hypothetical protein